MPVTPFLVGHDTALLVFILLPSRAKAHIGKHRPRMCLSLSTFTLSKPRLASSRPKAITDIEKPISFFAHVS